MPALSNEVLWKKLLASLPPGSTAMSEPHEVRPFLADVPELGRVRVYLWTLTEDRSKTGARPAGEFKIQLIVPGQSRGKYASLDLADYPTVLLGYSPDYGIFVGWEARLYTEFAYSTNLQVREDLLVQARDDGWAVAAPRPSHDGQEVRVAFGSTHLPRFVAASVEADGSGMEGERREAFFLSKAPRAEPGEMPQDPVDLPAYVAVARRRIAAARFLRDPRFSADVKREYDFACAVCTAQLGIVEAAHIIPASEALGVDEVWNGIALCPNHHRLFDARLFVIDSELVLRIDAERVGFLVETGRGMGVEQVRDFAGQAILKPTFWAEPSELRARMQAALQWVVDRAGMA